MSFLLLMRAEWRKLRASSPFQLIAVVILVLSVGWPTWCAVLFAFSDNDFCATDALPWPESALGAMGLMDGLALPLVGFLFSWLIGAEFGRDTWKMSLPRRPPTPRRLASPAPRRVLAW